MNQIIIVQLFFERKFQKNSKHEEITSTNKTTEIHIKDVKYETFNAILRMFTKSTRNPTTNK